VYQGTGSTADPCHTGDTTKENQVNDRETLLVCTFTDAVGSQGHVPASTDQPGGGRLQWTITSNDPGGVVATRFVGQPPSETDANGQATVQLEAFRPGNDIVTVQMFDDNGQPNGTAATITKRVTGVTLAQCQDSFDNDNDGKTDFPQDPGCANAEDNDETDSGTPGSDTSSKSTITIRYDGDSHGGTFKGAVANNKNKCVKGRSVKLFRVRRGPDQNVGSDTTNRSGNWSIREPGANGRFYAKVAGSRFQKPDGFTHRCGRDKSVTIRVQS
jgi:hypothetical protein